MMRSTIIGVSRGQEFSPNHLDNDAAIFRIVVEELEQKGFQVETLCERAFVAQDCFAPVLFTMARSEAALDKLAALEKQGAAIVNSPVGIERCIRYHATELLMKAHVPIPHSKLIQLNKETGNPATSLFEPCTDEILEEFTHRHSNGLWIKRGDSSAMVKEDVFYSKSGEGVEERLKDFDHRGITSLVINEHLIGDLVKFYGVYGTPFFYWFYPSPDTHCKFGLEVINGPAQGFSFSQEKLMGYCSRAAEVLRVPIYGGDCIISSTGEIQIIDFNDWPSFARCREEAGKHIAQHITTYCSID